MELILASQSPRRKELLGLFGLPFVIRVADIDETMDKTASAYDEVARVSREKAMAVERARGDIVVAADTIVVCENKVLGKPHSQEEAMQMLRLLSGRDHQVMTGMTVLRDEKCLSCTQVTDIHFRELSDKEIRAYIATKEPMDKAGSYGIQEWIGFVGVESISGSYFNVMGLPIQRLYTELKKI